MDRAIADWANNHGYQILELKPCTVAPSLELGDCAQAQFYLVKVIDPDLKPLWFVLKTGFCFLGGSVKRLQALMLDQPVVA